MTFRPLSAITHDFMTISIRGGIVANRMTFEPQIQWQDISNMKAPVFLTIKMPTAPS